MTQRPAEIFSTIDALLQSLIQDVAGKTVFVLTDDHVSALWMSRILENLNQFCEPDLLEIESGEDSKSIEICNHLWSHLLDCKADRSAIILNIGGGVVSDLGGFVASVFKRGVSFVNIPTSLMGMVDAAIGGKTAINHGGIKNSLGSFCPPIRTLICQDFLSTLPHHEMKSGFAEMLKIGIVADKDHWLGAFQINQISSESIFPLVSKSILLKEKIVANDFRETGERKMLNFGHTFGHALESYFMSQKEQLTHGECVAIGMQIEIAIAFKIALCNAATRDEITSGIHRFFPLTSYRLPTFVEIIDSLMNDKKNTDNELKLSLPNNIGECSTNVGVDLKMAEQVYAGFCTV